MLAIMGTSTCHVMNHDQLVEVPGMCGVVDGGILAGSFGYEAGQSGVGDIFAWYVDNQVPERYFQAARRRRRVDPRPPHRRWRSPNHRARTGWSRSTGSTGTARCSSTPRCPV